MHLMKNFQKVEVGEVLKFVTPDQARSQKFAMGGLFGGLGAEPPALKNFAFFYKNNLILELF